MKPTTGNSNKFNLFHGFLEFLMYLGANSFACLDSPVYLSLGGVMNAVILTVLADAFLDNQIMEGASAYIAWCLPA